MSFQCAVCANYVSGIGIARHLIRKHYNFGCARCADEGRRYYWSRLNLMDHMRQHGDLWSQHDVGAQMQEVKEEEEEELNQFQDTIEMVARGEGQDSREIQMDGCIESVAAVRPKQRIHDPALSAWTEIGENSVARVIRKLAKENPGLEGAKRSLVGVAGTRRDAGLTLTLMVQAELPDRDPKTILAVALRHLKEKRKPRYVPKKGNGKRIEKRERVEVAKAKVAQALKELSPAERSEVAQMFALAGPGPSNA